MNIVTNIIDRYLKKSMEFFDTKFEDYVIDKYNRDSNFIREELQKYLNKCTKNYYVKSLLYKEKGQLITDVYVNIPLKDFEDEEIVIEKIIENIIDKYLNNEDMTEKSKQKKSSYIFISGIGGCGKSVLMKKLFLNFLTVEKRRILFIPILIRLRELKLEYEEDFLEKYLKKYFLNMGINFEEKLIERFLEDGRIVLLLDGLDELSFHEKEIFTKSLDMLKRKYEDLTIIVSARPEVKAISFPEFSQYRISQMDKNLVGQYIDKLPDNSIRKNEVKKRILEDDYYNRHRELVGYPLMLAVILLTFDYNGELPINRRSFFSKIFSTMLITHDREKEVIVERRIQSCLSQEDLEKLWRIFCFITYMQNIITFDEYSINKSVDIAIAKFTGNYPKKYPELKRGGFLNDVINILCFIVEEGPNYDFIHRSFQEYYAAEFMLGLREDVQKRIFLEDRNIFYSENKELLQYLRMIDEDKYIYTCIAPIVSDLLEKYGRCISTEKFIEKYLDIIVFDNIDPYIMYKEMKFSIIREEVSLITQKSRTFPTIKIETLRKSNYPGGIECGKEFNSLDIELKEYVIELVECEIKFLKDWYEKYTEKEAEDQEDIIDYLTYSDY